MVATRPLPAGLPVLTEPAIFCGSDDAQAIRRACQPDDVQGMLEAWERPREGGSNPLAHFDLFCQYALAREEAEADVGGVAAAMVRRAKEWFCVPEDGEVDLAEQRQKVEMVHGAFRPELRRLVSVAELTHLDGVARRNAEELAGAPALQLPAAGSSGRPPCLAPRRFQGIFACKDLIQHSCAANCATVAGPPSDGVDGGCAGPLPACGTARLVQHIVPLRALEAGERLSWNYLPYWKQLWPTDQRRMALSESWNFHCRCARCEGPRPEASMAFKCPACGADELCPAGPCTVPGGAAGDAGHAEALGAVRAMVCLQCGVRLPVESSSDRQAAPCSAAQGGCSAHAGYVERCMAQEAAGFALPWMGALGRDLQGARGRGELSLLAPSHWLLADQASHDLENVQDALELHDLSCAARGAGAELALTRCMNDLARGAGVVSAALQRLHGPVICTALPELALYGAVFGDREDRWDACRASYHTVLGGFAAGRATAETVGALCDSLPLFISRELARLERMRARLPGDAGAQDVPGAEALLRAESDRVVSWLGRGCTTECQGCTVWATRRLWSCPDFGWQAPEEGEEEETGGGEEEESAAESAEESEAPENAGISAGAQCAARDGPVAKRSRTSEVVPSSVPP